MKAQAAEGWARKYPPLLSLVVAGLLAAFVLPSALNLPQTNPAQTVEYAPVPPSDDSGDPPPGNVSSLGLGSSGELGDDTLGVGPDTLLPPPPPLPPGEGGNPSGKRCVGSPPRQTEDPLSPPCVASFSGQNFGATANGVSAHEVKVLFYIDGSKCDGTTDRGFECPTKGSFADVSDAPKANDHIRIRELRAWQRYFNTRYQTYDRKVHFIIYYSTESSGAATPELRRADAAKTYAQVHPFAVLSSVTRYADDYLAAMAERGVLNFGSLDGRSASFYKRYPGRVWSVLPSLEQAAAVYADYVCKKVIPYPVSMSGNAGENGKKRVLGLLSSADPSRPAYATFAARARTLIEACGGQFKATASYPVAGSASGTNASTGANNNSVAATNMASFRQAGVTTVIWPEGYETFHSRAAAQLGYRPEWILAGDRQFEGYQTANFEEQSVWGHHTVVVTPLSLVKPGEIGPCYQAMNEAEPANTGSKDTLYTCSFLTDYVDLRMLFTGIQVAGPRLTQASIDQGFHAIPAVQSKDPSVQACFFNTGDYTCVKDAAAAWWDETAPGGSAAYPNGCWRYAERGLRHISGGWPRNDITAQQRPDDPCNSFNGAIG